MFVPLRRQHTLFLRIACFAAWHQVKFFRTPSPGKGNHMIHGQFFGGELRSAIVTYSGRSFSLPPLAVPKLPGLGPFLFCYNIVGKRKKNIYICHIVPILISKFTEVPFIGHPIPGYLNKQLKQHLAAQHLFNIFPGV